MRTLTSRIGAGAAAAAAILAVAGVATARQPFNDAQPWLEGRCYLARILEPAQEHRVRVLAPLTGPWVRVRSDPRTSRIPGGAQRGPVWLNTSIVYAVEEIECSAFPGD